MDPGRRAGWRRAAFGVYVAVSALALTVFLIGFMHFSATSDIPFLFWGMILASVALLGGLFLTDFPLAEVAAAPGPTLSYLASRLRFAQSRVEEGEEGLKVRLGSVAVVRIRVFAVEGVSRVTFRADLASSALSTLILSMFLFPFAPVAFLLTVYAFMRARSFALRSVTAFLPSGTSIPETEPRDDVAVHLVNGLAEGHRLAAEAYEAEHDSYIDTQGIVFLGALLVWVVVLVLTLLAWPDPDFSVRIAVSFWTSIPAATAFGVVVAGLVRYRFLPRLQRYRDRAEALRLTWAREVARVPSEAAGPSAFEVLAESSREVPDWLDAIRRRGLSRDPASDFLVIAGFFWTIWLVGGVVSAVASGNLSLAAVLLLVGASLTAGLVKFYRRAKRRWEEQVARELREWTQRFDDLRSKIDRFLQDL